jgi:hypothetical protein
MGNEYRLVESLKNLRFEWDILQNRTWKSRGKKVIPALRFFEK